MIGAGLAAAVAWNLITWRFGIPSSSGNALVGGLVGASVRRGASTLSIGAAWTGFIPSASSGL